MEVAVPEVVDAFRHEALLYSSADEFLAGTVPFIEEGLASGEAVLVVELPEKIELLRSYLGPDALAVRFADMGKVGSNPALIIPAWRDFVARNLLEGRPMRGIGEPIYASRRPAELVECQRHEELLNVAFDGGEPWRLLCPYDTSALTPAVVSEARRSHPFVQEASGQIVGSTRGLGRRAPFDAPFSEAPRDHDSLLVDAEHLDRLRLLVANRARDSGMNEGRIADLVSSVNEVATNSLRHGGGVAYARIWTEDGALVSEVKDNGRFDTPLVDRERPARDARASRGLWLANHLVDLVQIRSSQSGTAVRLHMWLDQDQGN
jgi:anti-sigma regulatory factor (Ser/Thr protein kinase)